MPAYNPSIVLKPTSISEAVKILREYGPSARVVAGNTTLYELSKQGALADVDKLVDVSRLSLYRIIFENDLLRVGASVSFSSIAKSDFTTRNPWLALRETAKKITPPQIPKHGNNWWIPVQWYPVLRHACDSSCVGCKVDSRKR